MKSKIYAHFHGQIKVQFFSIIQFIWQIYTKISIHMKFWKKNGNNKIIPPLKLNEIIVYNMFNLIFYSI